MRAPDHGRLRPWRFILIESAQRGAFGELLADQARRGKPGATPEVLERERQKAFRAPLIIAVAAVPAASAKIPAIEQVLSAAAAAQSMVLAAYAQGFNAIWKTGDAAYDDEVKRALGLEPKDSIVGFLYVGTEEGDAARCRARHGATTRRCGTVPGAFRPEGSVERPLDP